MRRLRTFLTALLVLSAAFLIEPMIRTARHLCPVRPDGLDQAEALPSFARKYKISCSQCHLAYPVLNAYGRQFKMNGFVREPGSSDGVLQTPDKQLWTESIFPWAAIIRSRPVDNGKGTVSNQGSQMGGTQSPNPNGFKMQPLNDVDMFLAGGDAGWHISYLGELDANAAGGFSPGLGDIRLGYHPASYFNIIGARRSFFADDPYQSIVSNESPTIADRATDLLMSDQGSISGNQLNAAPQQMMAVNGTVNLPHGDAFLYYSAAATKDNPGGANASDGGWQSQSPTNGNVRLAFDSGSGLMIGTFGTLGSEVAASGLGTGGGLGVDAGTGEQQHFVRGGFDALYEVGGLAARGAFAYSHDTDNTVGGADTDRAAYVELAYAYKKDKADYPFLMPLVRENWYTTFNGTQQFNYVTAQIAHYFAPNVKAFLEASADTKRGYQGGTLASPSSGALAALGNRLTLQIEVGF